MEIVWKIFEISAENELITHAKYYCSLSDDTNTVETEGNWFFKDPIMNIPFGQVTEEMVAKWIEDESVKDGVNIITTRLEEQLKSLEKKTVVPPWKPQVFTPSI